MRSARHARIAVGTDVPARDAIATPQIGSDLKVVAVRALKNKGHDSFAELQIDLVGKRKRKEISHADAQYQVEVYWTGALRRAVKEGDDALHLLIKEGNEEVLRAKKRCQSL